MDVLVAHLQGMAILLILRKMYVWNLTRMDGKMLLTRLYLSTRTKLGLEVEIDTDTHPTKVTILIITTITEVGPGVVTITVTGDRDIFVVIIEEGMVVEVAIGNITSVIITMMTGNIQQHGCNVVVEVTVAV